MFTFVPFPYPVLFLVSLPLSMLTTTTVAPNYICLQIIYELGTFRIRLRLAFMLKQTLILRFKKPIGWRRIDLQCLPDCHPSSFCKASYKTLKSIAYISLVRSILEYGYIVWDPYVQQDIQCIENIQKRAARFIIGDYRTCSQSFMTRTLQDIGLPPLHERRLFNRLSFLYKIANRLVPALQNDNRLTRSDNKRRIKPTQYSGYISENHVANRSRNNSKCFINIDSVSAQYKNSFFPRTIVKWNALDNSIVCEPDINSFKAKLKTHMFD